MLKWHQWMNQSGTFLDGSFRWAALVELIGHYNQRRAKYYSNQCHHISAKQAPTTMHDAENKQPITLINRSCLFYKNSRGIIQNR